MGLNISNGAWKGSCSSFTLWTEEGYIDRNVDGWIMPFYTQEAYTELLSNKKYALATGILSSEIKDGYLVPNFEKFIVEL